MSKYTTEVRFICENAAGLQNSGGYANINAVLDKAVPKVFNFDFPIFDESYRNVLCKKILKHYYTREICEETVGLWKLRLDARMNEIMPYYNQLYRSELIEFNPLYDVEVTTTGKRGTKEDGTVDTDTENTSNSNDTSTGHSETSSTTNITDRDLYSETPQGALTNIENEEYLTNARKKTVNETVTDTGDTNSSSTSVSNNTGKSKQSSTANSTEDYLQTVMGKQSGTSYSKLLREYRDTFLNIDMQVIESLSDLFFGLW